MKYSCQDAGPRVFGDKDTHLFVCIPQEGKGWDELDWKGAKRLEGGRWGLLKNLGWSPWHLAAPTRARRRGRHPWPVWLCEINQSQGAPPPHPPVAPSDLYPIHATWAISFLHIQVYLAGPGLPTVSFWLGGILVPLECFIDSLSTLPSSFLPFRAVRHATHDTDASFWATTVSSSRWSSLFCASSSHRHCLTFSRRSTCLLTGKRNHYADEQDSSSFSRLESH